MNGPSHVANASLGEIGEKISGSLAKLERDEAIPRLWNKDPSLWNGNRETPELSNRLGWLRCTSDAIDSIGEWNDWGLNAADEFSRIVLCGMGGSSLAPEVLWRVAGGKKGYPEFVMLDSTAPSAVAAVDPREALFVIASKSGTTLETNCFLSYFWHIKNGDGATFVAITDPDTPLESLARERKFRHVATAPQDVGGRFAALSSFGLVPAAFSGVDIGAVIQSASKMETKCRTSSPAENPGAWLGAVIAQSALDGRDKLTLALSPSLASFGLWVEQLVAESTGKNGAGIVPVVENEIGSPDEYGDDRLFIALELEGDDSDNMNQALDLLQAEGHPVVRYSLSNALSIGGEFFRWEFATAIAGHLLGVNPFDQPNVAESKKLTGQFLKGELALKFQEWNSAEVANVLANANAGDYLSLQIYAKPSSDLDARLLVLASKIRRRLRVAVTCGYGPRYLHSTGQLHKGGPKCGSFVQVVSHAEADVSVPGENFTFSDVMRAQADGDYQALTDRGLPIVRVASLDMIEEALEGL